MSHPTAQPVLHTEQEGHRTSWALLAVALAAQILVVLDISVVNTALPSHRTGPRPRRRRPPVARHRLPDDVRRRPAARWPHRRPPVPTRGLPDRPDAVHPASLVSGFADNGTQLIAARAVQGLSAALLTPSALALIMTTYAGAQRKTALALWGAVGSLGVAAGVLLGGAVTTWAGWQSIFWINGPIGVVALVVGHHVIAKRPSTRPGVARLRPPRRRHRHRRPGHPHLRPRRHRHPRLVVRPDRGRARPSRPSWWRSFLKIEQARDQAAVPAAHVEAQDARLGHHGDARRHRHPGRRRLPDLDLPADRPRILRPGDRDSRSCRSRSPSPSAPSWPGTCSSTSRRAASPATGLLITAAAAVLLSTATSSAHFATDLLPGLLGHGPGRRHGLRARLGDLDGRHPRLRTPAWPRAS